MQLPKTILLGSILLLSAPYVAAQGFYVDGGYATASTDLDTGIDELDDSIDLTFGLVGGHAGYDFTPYFGVEGEVYFGVQDDSHIETFDFGGESVDLDLSFDIKHLVGAYARGNLPLGERFRAFARAGYVTSEIEISSGGETVETDSGFDQAYALGLGGEFDFTEQIYARGDYTRYEFDDLGLDTFMASVGFRF